MKTLTVTGFILIGIAIYLKTDSEIASVRESSKLPYETIWHWEDHFSSVEQKKIESWLGRVLYACDSKLGTYPFNTHLYIYKHNNAAEPVPWAHTRRYQKQSVHFYIDPEYTLEDFLTDWTAPHEISHLSLPYLGSENAWFAEGYASYMQYQIMLWMGVMTEQEVKAKYQEKLTMLKRNYSSQTDVKTIALEMKRQNRYPEMYWGGSTYFMILDQMLQKEGTNLPSLMQEYLNCCRNSDESLSDVLQSWDKLLGNDLASNLHQKFTTRPANEVLSSLWQPNF